MSTFEQLRIPASLVLIIAAVFIFLPRGGSPGSAASTLRPATLSSPTAGQPGGQVIETPPATPMPTLTPAGTPERTASPRPTPTPVTGGDFAAEVLACRSTSGSACNGRLGRLPAEASEFTALVRFSGAASGDAISVVLDGPGGSVAGAPYTLQGGGDGYYYSIFQVGGMQNGEYTVTATRNGAAVATTSFRRGG
jgi:hypothetical protein